MLTKSGKGWHTRSKATRNCGPILPQKHQETWENCQNQPYYVSGGRYLCSLWNLQKSSYHTVPSFWWFAGNLWHFIACEWIIPFLCLHMAFSLWLFTWSLLCSCLCLYPNVPFCKKHRLDWMKVYPNSFILNWLHLHRPYFQMKSHSEVMQIRNATLYFGRGCKIWPIIYCNKLM